MDLILRTKEAVRELDNLQYRRMKKILMAETSSEDASLNGPDELVGESSQVGKIVSIVFFRICQFLMTDSICHSSLPCAVLEKVALISVEFCIYPCKKIDSCIYQYTIKEISIQN